MSYDAAEEEDEEDALGDEVFALMDSDGDGKVKERKHWWGDVV